MTLEDVVHLLQTQLDFFHLLLLDAFALFLTAALEELELDATVEADNRTGAVVSGTVPQTRL